MQSAPECIPDAHISFLNLYPGSMTDTSQLRTLDLRLMYHYTAVVRHTMPGCKGAPAEAWQRTIPQLSFESEMVLQPMLALSALHLHAHSPDNVAMAIALRRYLHQSLVKHRQALSSPSEGLSEQLWLSGVLLSHIYGLIARQRQPNEAYELPLQAFKVLEGVSAIFVQKNVDLSRQGYNWIGNESLPHIAPVDELSPASQVQLRSIEEDLTKLLNAFDVPALPEANKSIYTEAKDYVFELYGAFYTGTDATTLQRFIGTMAVRCQPGYRNLLEKHDPLAMVLMGRAMVLLSALDHAWWVNGQGDYEVVKRDIRGICELIPAKLRWAMDWPCRVLEKKIILNRDQPKSASRVDDT
jgi:Fungal specific transcription factor domain